MSYTLTQREKNTQHNLVATANARAIIMLTAWHSFGWKSMKHPIASASRAHTHTRESTVKRKILSGIWKFVWILLPILVLWCFSFNPDGFRYRLIKHTKLNALHTLSQWTQIDCYSSWRKREGKRRSASKWLKKIKRIFCLLCCGAWSIEPNCYDFSIFSFHFVLNKLFILIFYSLSILCSRLTMMDKKILHWFTFFFHFQSRLFLFRGVRQSASSKLFGQ